ncbi:hypothetical protein WN55_09276 [Dufourea novaeangliae]|uniref:Uncharacterized protein n=1 Tax=Dufourea novaeangliae TaxID=178035 RepID=A0A154P955_DUFNO|nr:hypothetical protein WN55_09276 [Dufourea novaeangliae]
MEVIRQYFSHSLKLEEHISRVYLAKEMRYVKPACRRSNVRRESDVCDTCIKLEILIVVTFSL